MSKQAKRLFAIFIALTILAGMVVAFYYISMEGCAKLQSPTFNNLVNGLNSNFEFKNEKLKLMAQRIYEYRSSVEYKSASDEFISIFINPKDPTSPIDVSLFINDVALHKLATADANMFNVLVSYIPIFNHPRYLECIRAYDSSSMEFKNIDSNKSTKEIIINDILRIDEISVDDKYAELIRKDIKSKSDKELFDILMNGYKQ